MSIKELLRRIKEVGEGIKWFPLQECCQDTKINMVVTERGKKEEDDHVDNNYLGEQEDHKMSGKIGNHGKIMSTHLFRRVSIHHQIHIQLQTTAAINNGFLMYWHCCIDEKCVIND